MESKFTVQGLRSKNTIVLHPSEGQPINISRDTNEILFLEVEELLNQNKMDEIVHKFLDIKGKIERYSLNLFTVDEEKGLMYLKGTEHPMPELMVDKLFELEQAGEDFMPLIRFWKKLQKNPSTESIEQLYGFMVHNGIGITELGDIITEKGVSVKNGILVDERTKTIDNSIGESPAMLREKVDADPTVTCSFGLHVGAPDYVRKFYSSSIIVRCIVNPADVVAVPIDYNNTKMRVCRYTVVGYSEENTSHKPLFKLDDFVTTPSEAVQDRINKSKPKPVLSEVEDGEEEAFIDSDEWEDDEDNLWDDQDWDYDGCGDEEEMEEDYHNSLSEVEEQENAIPDDNYTALAEQLLSGMTGKQILNFVETETGIRMPYSDKSKATLIKRGAELLTKQLNS